MSLATHTTYTVVQLHIPNERKDMQASTNTHKIKINLKNLTNSNILYSQVFLKEHLKNYIFRHHNVRNKLTRNKLLRSLEILHGPI